MRKRKVIATVAAGVVLLLVGFLAWYRAQYSMTLATSYERGEPAVAQRVLIATQGSAYKNELVRDVVDHLDPDSVYVKVIDVSMLPGIREGDWTAILILHTWEYGQPQENARNFIHMAQHPERILVITTSGSGRERMPGVDVISAASEMSEVPAQAAEVTRKVEALLKANAG